MNNHGVSLKNAIKMKSSYATAIFLGYNDTENVQTKNYTYSKNYANLIH